MSRDLSALHGSHNGLLKKLAERNVSLLNKILSKYEADFSDELQKSNANIAEFETMIRERLHHGVTLVADAYQTIVGDRETPGPLALAPLAFITLPKLGLAWGLRHMSRIVLQSPTRRADAQLCGTIANPYTALISQNQSTPAELAIALNALFRPIDDSGHAEIALPI
jgi:hypothetical protein